MENARSLRQTG